MPPAGNSPKFDQFESVIETIAREIVIFDKDGNFVYGNGPARKDENADSLKKQPSLDRLYTDVEFRDIHGNVIPPESYPSVKARRGIATRGNIFQFINKKTGQHTWYETNAIPLFGENNNVSYVIISYQDVTKKIQQEEKLKFLVDAFKILAGTLDFNVLLHRLARLMVPTLADWSAIDILDNDGVLRRLTVVHENPAMVELVHEVDKFFPQDPDAESGTYHVIKSGQSEFVPVVTPAMIASIKNDEARKLLERLGISAVMTVPIGARGKVLGALTLVCSESKRHYSQEDLEFALDFCNHIGILLDNAKLYQEIEGENQNKERFLAVLSHELRNPLAPIANSIEMLRMKDIDDSAINQELKVINRQFKYMEKILKDLLEVSRLTSGTILLEKTPLDLRKVINDAVGSVRPVAANTNHTIHVSLPEETVRVMGDTIRLTQIVINLLDNAIKFTPENGSIWINLAVQDGNARLSIKDNGIGIRAKLLPHIFDLYTKKPRQSSDQLNRGLGLGLVLVKKLLELHGASIVAMSDGIDHGSEFLITIPLYAGAPEKTLQTPPAVKNNYKELISGMKIMIADDNRDAADALARLFNMLGADAHAIYFPTEVVAAVERLEPDLLIMDIGMPELDGHELAQILRKNGFKKTMVALTGYSQSRDKQRVKESGFDYHLTKPARLDDFTEIFLAVAKTEKIV